MMRGYGLPSFLLTSNHFKNRIFEMLVKLQDRSIFRSLSEIFSRPYFRGLISGHNRANFHARALHHRAIFDAFDIEDNHSFIKQTYALLKRFYCNEYVFKNEILNAILLKKVGSLTAINELQIGSSIADMVLVNGVATLFEIKTNLDSPERLNSQLKDYEKAISRVNLVVSYQDFEQYYDLYKRSPYGIYEFTKRGALCRRKEAEDHVAHIEHEALFKMLRKEEYLSIVNKVWGTVPDVPNTQIFRSCLALMKKVDVLEFQKLVFQEIKSRKPKYLTPLIEGKVPHALTQLYYTLDLAEVEYQKFNSFLSEKNVLSIS